MSLRTWLAAQQSGPASHVRRKGALAPEIIRKKSILQYPRAELSGLVVLAGGDGGGGLVFARCAHRVSAAGGMGAVGAIAVAVGTLGSVEIADQVRITFRSLVQLVVAGDVAGLLRPFALLLIGLDDGALDDFAAGGVDGMGDVGMELGPAVGVAGGPVLVQLVAALIAVTRPQMILAAALLA